MSREVIAKVYDGFDDTLMAEVYEPEVIPTFERLWFARIEMVNDE